MIDILRLIGALIFMIALIILSLKIGAAKLNTLSKGRYINILEKTQLSKNSSLVVAKIGKEGYVISSTEKGNEILLKMEMEELTEMETNKEEQIKKYSENFSSFCGTIKKNIKNIKGNRK